jgi:FLVCR family feline leukemia virus subgroup C receptor-related protein
MLFSFQNAEEFIGRAGLVMIVIGMVGSITFGIILDKTHKFKETTFFTYLMSSVSVVAFMFALEMKSKILVYISIGTVGLFTNAYMPVGFEMAMELTYPSSEGTTTGLLMAPSQVLGVIFALLMSYLTDLIGPFWSLGTQVLLLAIGTVITCFVPNKLKRQEAFKERLNEDVPLKVIER